MAQTNASADNKGSSRPTGNAGTGARAQRSDDSTKLARLQQAVLNLSLGLYGQHFQFDRHIHNIQDALANGYSQTAVQRCISTLVEEAIKLDFKEQQQAALEDGQELKRHPVIAQEEFAGFLNDLHKASGNDKIAKLPKQAVAGMSQADLFDLLDETTRILATLLSAPDAIVVSTELVRHTSDTLLQLLDQLSFPKDMLEDVAVIREKLSNTGPKQSMDEVVEAITTLITNMELTINKETSELKAIINHVNIRLEEFKVNLDQSDGIREQTWHDTSDLSGALDYQLANIRADCSHVSNVEQLRGAVDRHLHQIQSNVTSFVDKEKRRQGASEKIMERLNHRIQTLSTETERLRKRIADEHAKAMSDQLTGLPNRRAYEERSIEEFVRWQRRGGTISLLVLDIDKFKAFNDNYGHSAGDKALKSVSDVLRANIRKTDFVARIGGEEFVVILPSADSAGAFIAAEKLRTAVEACPFIWNKKPITVTISCGIAEFQDGDDMETVYKRADQLLYRAKNEGRNRCCAEDQSLVA